MTTVQIYALVNAVNAQAFGSSALTLTGLNDLISLGNTVLSSSTNTEAFLNTLAQRIGRTIIDYRKYTNKLRGLVIDDFEYGAILQKIKIQMPEAEADESFDLTNGGSVDHYKVAKPTAIQKLFVSRTPYQFHITVQREHLKEAFLSEVAMGSFISGVFGEVQNAIELALENLGRTCINNFFGETTKKLDLVTAYNTELNLAGDDALPTGIEALHTPAFVNYAMARINETIDKMQDMTSLFNDGTVMRFTPQEDQRIIMNSIFMRRAETVSQYAAFHDKFVNVDGAYTKTNFWQSSQAGSELDIKIKRSSDGTTKEIANIIGCVHDRDALGIYKIQEDVLTSPVNAAGMYYNTYWHERQLWFNDLSENFIYFTLN